MNIIGGGIIGLSIAFELLERGVTGITVHDPDPASGAGLVAAGMLAPTAEANFGEEALQGLMTASMRRWPGFAARVEARTGQPLGYRTEGTLLVALTGDDQAEIDRLVGFYRRAGAPIEPLSGRELREREPLLSPRVRGGAFAPGDHQVDPRRLLGALRSLPLRFVSQRIEDLATVLPEPTVIATGAAAASLTGLPVRPVKGQLLRLRGPEPLLTRVVRGVANGRHVYLVPRSDGELVVGATEEERGEDRTVTAGGVLDLLRPAADLLPGATELALAETLAGLRPGTPDNAPIIGGLGPDLLVATGHHRNGVLLAPVTAEAVADLATRGSTTVDLSAFGATRFT